jgi:hypothetical protein
VLIIRAVALDISVKTAFEDFLGMCAELFWQLLDSCLRNVRSTIESKVKPGMTGLFESLLADLKGFEEPFLIPELDAAILNAQTKAQQALEQVKDWFRVKPLTERDFTFEEIVHIGLASVKNLHPDFAPKLTINAPHDLFRMGQLNLFSDIFFIIFDNVRKHSGMMQPRVTVSASLGRAGLEIEVVNQLAASAITPEREVGVAQIREAIAQGGYLPAVRSEGGTGLKKLRNILMRDGVPVLRPDFGFRDRTFFVRFDLSVVGVIREEVAE